MGDLAPGFGSYLLFLFGVLALAAFLSLALVSTALALTSMCLIGGIISSAKALHLLRRAIAGEFKTRLLQIGGVLGAIAGAAAGLNSNLWNSPWRWPLGIFVGSLCGIAAAGIFNRVSILLARFLAARVQPPV